MSDDTEAKDAARVDDAIAAIAAGDLGRAKQTLTAVIQHTPSEYAHQVEDDDGSLGIKFWDQIDFVHHVTWQTPARDIRWIPSAYPRAYYFLGFIAVKEGEYRQAIAYLNQGAALEPTNPKFNFEKAQALVRLGERREALQLYEAACEVGPFVSGHDVAMALRGKGFVLIELGVLQEASAAFHKSLELEPESEVAHNELKYIAHLEQGGARAPLESVPTSAGDLAECAVCRQNVESGTVVNLDGIPLVICARCMKRLTKKWWQFWK